MMRTSIMKNLLAAIGVFVLWFGFWHFFDKALAYRPGGQNSTYFVTTSVTVGTSSAQALGVDPNRSYLMMCNLSATATVFWSTLTNGAAVVNGAGSIPLLSQSCTPPFDGIKFTDGINMIASAASTPVTILTVD